MCMSHKVRCTCGRESAEFSMRDEVMAPGVIKALYCPSCGEGLDFSGETMLDDNGWVIEYDMEQAGIYSSRLGLPAGKLTPEFIFDEGYCTWAGYCPGDIRKAAEEKAEIVKMMKTDPKTYVKALMVWGKERAQRLGREGWRKARAAV